MRKKLLIFGTFLKLRLLMNFQFPVSYWLGFAGQFIFYGATFCVIFIAVSSFGNLAGWTADEVLLLYAFELISYAIGAFFCFHPSSGLVNNIRTGAFDASLTKPMNPFLFQICNYGLDIAYLSHFTLSLGVMILALMRVGITPTLVNITTIILFILGAAAIQGGFLVLCSVFSFKMVNENPMFAYFKEIFDLDGIINQPVRLLSLGEKMRATIAGAMLHSPEILFLDEPTIGLDVTSKLKIRDFIKRINEKSRTTIILTSHDMGDIDYQSNRHRGVRDQKSDAGRNSEQIF